MAAPTPFRSSRHTRAILVADWRDAEELARWHMCEVLGFRDAALTPSGADGGIDVVSARALAQVKHHNTPVGSPEVQQHVGASHRTKDALFYALSGYTAAALEYANTAQLGLFTYNIYGDVHPTNDRARQLQARSATTTPETERDAASERLHRDAAAAAATFDRELAAAVRFSEQFSFARTLEADEVEDLQRFVLVELMSILAMLEDVRQAWAEDDQSAVLTNAIVAELGVERSWQEWIHTLAHWRHRALEVYARLVASKERGRAKTLDDRAKVFLADAYRRDSEGELRLTDRWKSRPVGNDLRYTDVDTDWYIWAVERMAEVPEWWRPAIDAQLFGLTSEQHLQRSDVDSSDYRDGGPWTLV
ncbi:restriction endonuclease [Isoptericola sp. NPDC056605]|uniref:restriction endonuclease n=1 Tax=Isoptericola sp. NPDC056605 TaxID=3345876 RepID=UPI0036753E7C